MSAPESSLAPSILLVEDDASIASAVAELLRREGYAVAVACDGRVALSHLIRHRVKLVISDIFMPECDGIELLTQLRRFTPPVPVLAISGVGVRRVTSALRMAAGLGAARTLAKPFSAMELLAAVRELAGPAGGAGA